MRRYNTVVGPHSAAFAALVRRVVDTVHAAVGVHAEPSEEMAEILEYGRVVAGEEMNRAKWRAVALTRLFCTFAVCVRY